MTTLHDQWTALYTAGRVRWMPGMLTDRGRIVRLQGPQFCEVYSADALACGLRINEPADSLSPDFTDPATIGCLLHQAREAWGDMTAHIHGCLWDMNGDVVPPQWTMIGVTPPAGQSVVGWHLTEPAAILAAIAAAPPKVNP